MPAQQQRKGFCIRPWSRSESRLQSRSQIAVANRGRGSRGRGPDPGNPGNPETSWRIALRFIVCEERMFVIAPLRVMTEMLNILHKKNMKEEIVLDQTRIHLEFVMQHWVSVMLFLKVKK